MAIMVLIFVGSVLLINGVVFLGKVEARSAAPINFLVGAALVGAVLVGALPVRGDDPESLNSLLGAVGLLLFAFTYLTVGFNNQMGLKGNALGWYCGWASLIALFLSAANFTQIADPRFGWLWLSWAVLFFAFFLSLTTDMAWIVRPTGALTVAQSFTTCTIPAALMLLDEWSDLALPIIAAVQVVVVSTFVAAALAARARAQQAARIAGDLVPAR